jgi:hypothetical protein
MLLKVQDHNGSKAKIKNGEIRGWNEQGESGRERWMK